MDNFNSTKDIRQCPSIYYYQLKNSQSDYCLYFKVRMREKRQRKPKNNPNEIYSLVAEPKRKIIKKKGVKSKAEDSIPKSDEIEECVPVPVPAKKKEKAGKKSKVKKDEKPLQLDMEAQEEDNQPIADQREREQSEKSQGNEPRLQNLVKLSENFKEIKAVHEENISQYNYHRKECEKLSQMMHESNDSLQIKAKELKTLARRIYAQSLEANKQSFLNPKTFTSAYQFRYFTKSLKKLIEAIQNCPYEDPLENLKLTKVVPEKLLSQKKPSHARQHKKELVIKNYIADFPYLTAKQEHIPLIQALLGWTKYSESSPLEPIQQFPCLFLRESSFPYSVIQQAQNMLFKLCRQESHQLAALIHELIQSYPQISDTSPSTIQQLLYKGLSSLKFISLPEQSFQLRSFCHSDHIYINTYPIQKQTVTLSHIYRDISTAYCVLNALRMLANFVHRSLVFALDRDSQDLGKMIDQIRDREDLGVRFERAITGNERQFVACSREDYWNLGKDRVELGSLGRNHQGDDIFLFQEERKRVQRRTAEIMSRYINPKDKDKDQDRGKDKDDKDKDKDHDNPDRDPENQGNSRSRGRGSSGSGEGNKSIDVEVDSDMPGEMRKGCYLANIMTQFDPNRKNLR